MCDPQKKCSRSEIKVIAAMPASWPSCCARCITKTTASDCEGTGAQLSDHHQRSDASDGSTEGAVQKLGHSLYWPTSLRGAPPGRVAGENRRSRRTPPGRVLLPTVRRPCCSCTSKCDASC